jgi:hypothetical protein
MLSKNDLSSRAYNNAIRKWGRSTRSDIINEGHRLGINSKSGSLERIRNSYGMRHGEIIRASFGIVRHLIYVHKGVGRGWPISRQSGIVSALAGGRKPKPFFNGIIDRKINQLADDVAHFKADIIVENIKIR